MRKISIAQPYFIPYLAYFQLIFASDIFISYDSVNYIKNGWINRNLIQVQGDLKYLTIPLSRQSSNCLIKNTRVDWSKNIHDKIIKTLRMSYAKAPYKNDMLEIMSLILADPLDSIGDLALKSITIFCEYLSIKTSIKTSSSLNLPNKEDRTKNLLQIIHSQNAGIYINPIGGIKLYQKSDFYDSGVALLLLKGSITNSKIDGCMNSSREDVKTSLVNYSLI